MAHVIGIQRGSSATVEELYMNIGQTLNSCLQPELRIAVTLSLYKSTSIKVSSTLLRTN